MCGRFNLIDSPEVRLLCDLLGVQIPDSCISQILHPADKSPSFMKVVRAL